MEFHSRGGKDWSAKTNPQKKEIQENKIPKQEVVWVEVPSSPTASRARAVDFFFFNLGLRLRTHGDRGNGNREDLKEGFRIRMVFVWACGRKDRTLAGFCWACVRKGRTLAGERDHPGSAPRPCGRAFLLV